MKRFVLNCGTLSHRYPTSLAEDEALLSKLEAGDDGEAENSKDRMRQALHARISTKRALDQCREKCEIFVSLPTATATLRRPWKVNIRTSG